MDFSGCLSCLRILRLAKTYSDARLDAAAQRALALGAHSVRSVESILEHRLDEQPLHDAPECLRRFAPTGNRLESEWVIGMRRNQ